MTLQRVCVRSEDWVIGFIDLEFTTEKKLGFQTNNSNL